MAELGDVEQDFVSSDCQLTQVLKRENIIFQKQLFYLMLYRVAVNLGKRIHNFPLKLFP